MRTIFKKAIFCFWLKTYFFQAFLQFVSENKMVISLILHKRLSFTDNYFLSFLITFVIHTNNINNNLHVIKVNYVKYALHLMILLCVTTYFCLKINSKTFASSYKFNCLYKVFFEAYVIYFFSL